MCNCWTSLDRPQLCIQVNEMKQIISQLIRGKQTLRMVRQSWLQDKCFLVSGPNKLLSGNSIRTLQKGEMTNNDLYCSHS